MTADDTAAKQNKAISGNKGKAKSTKAQKRAVAYNSEGEEEDDDYVGGGGGAKKPVPKKTPPKRETKPAVVKPSTPNLDALQLDSSPVAKEGTKKRASPPAAKPGPAKKARKVGCCVSLSLFSWSQMLTISPSFDHPGR